MGKILKEITRPLAFALVLCILATMIPVSETDMKSYAAETSDLVGAHTVVDGEEWGERNISGGTITINAGVILKVSGIVTLKEGTVIEGGGVIEFGANAYFNCGTGNVGNVTFNNVTFSGSTSTNTPMISSQNYVNIISNNVTYKNGKTASAEHASVFLLNTPDSTVTFQGENIFLNNKGGKAPVYLRAERENVNFEGNVSLSGNTTSNGEDLFIYSNENSNKVNIKTDLPAEQQIPICYTKTKISDGFEFATAESEAQATAAAKVFYPAGENFHDYGVIADGANLKFTEKKAIDVKVTGKGSVAMTDSQGRNIIALSSSGTEPFTATAKEVPGKQVNISLTPKSSADFIREASFKDSTNLEIASMGACLAGESKTMSVTMPSVSASFDATFDRAVTLVSLGGIKKPMAFATADDSLKNLTISTIEPSTAVVTVKAVWINSANGNVMQPTDEFLSNNEYALKVTAEALSGSRFAGKSDLVIKALGENLTIGDSDQYSASAQSSNIEAQKMDINDAVDLGYVTVKINHIGEYPVIYDKDTHSPQVVVTDKKQSASNQSQILLAARVKNDTLGTPYSEKVSAGEASVFTPDEMILTTTAVGKPYLRFAGDYTVEITVTDANYDGTYVTETAFKINKRPITIAGITNAAIRPFDDTRDVSNAALLFNNLATIGGADKLVLGIDYGATFTYSDKNADVPKTIIVTGINLKNTELANNYSLAETSYSGAGGGITKVTPEEVAGALNWSEISGPGLKLGDIGFGLGAGKYFANPFKQLLKVFGSAQITKKLDGGSEVDVIGTTLLERDRRYRWVFTPADDTNYTTATGIITLWPSQPINAVTLSGIEIPSAGAVNNLTVSSLSAICGPSASSRVSFDSISWSAVHEGTPETFNTGDTFKYNRTYKLKIVMTANTGDKFITTKDAIKIGLSNANNVTTSIDSSGGELVLSFTLEFQVGKGNLKEDMFAVPTSVNYIYNGKNQDIAFTPAAEVSNSGLRCEVKLGAGGTYANGKSGYKDVGNDQNVYIKFTHEDYNGEVLKTQIMHISAKAIENIAISDVEKRPYDSTTKVAVALTSSDICSEDMGKVTFSAIGELSNPNVTSGSVTVTASSIKVGGERGKNYIISPAALTAVKTGTLNVIQKVTPTHSGITYTAVTIPNPTFQDLAITMTAVRNPYAMGLGQLSGKIISYYVAGGTTYNQDVTNPVTKTKEYTWEFTPTDSVNYNKVSGKAIYWPGAPIEVVTVSGINKPSSLQTPTAKSDIILRFADTSANVTASSITWYEEPLVINGVAKTSGHALGVGEKFKYNRKYTLVVELDARNGNDVFAPVSSFSAIMALTGENLKFDVEVSGSGINAKQAVLTYRFEAPTSKGTLSSNDLEYHYFNTYADSTTEITKSTKLKGDSPDTNYGIEYVYTGRYIGPAPEISGGAFDGKSLQYYKLAKFTYIVNGREQANAPRYQNYEAGVHYITIKMTHPDYDGDIQKTVSIQIQKCNVRPEGLTYNGKAYDGRTAINPFEVKLIWMPQSPNYELGTGTAIDNSLISYTADYEFTEADVKAEKSVHVKNIQPTANNFIFVINDIANKVKKVSDTECFITCGALITKSSITPMGNTILNRGVTLGVSLSALYGTYITTDCSIGNTTEAAFMRMVNPQNNSLKVHGQLGLATEGGVRFMTAAELEATTLKADTPYIWRFETATAEQNNYIKAVTGSQILYVTPTASGGGGGGGGGGAVEETTTAAITGEGVVVTGSGIDVAEQIHVYLAKDGKLVIDQYYYVNDKGAAVQRALKKVPGGNVVVNQDGKVVIKAIIENDTLKAYMKGDNYLTVEKRTTNYKDMSKHWSKQYVDFCSNRNLVKGTGEGKFSPDSSLTRGMAATIFYRLEESPALTDSARWFADVEKGEWYSDGIAWAGGEGIVKGIGIKNFAPHWEITREQMAVMIYNYCRIKQGAKAVSVDSLDMLIYHDSRQISDWAKEAVAYCYSTGLMQGDEDGNFCPQLSATRAEFATIMERLIRGIVNQTV